MKPSLMKNRIALAGILLLGALAIVISERRKVDVPADPAALLYLVADTEQELIRMPTSFTRMSDQEEIAIGNEMAKTYAVSGEAKTDPDFVAIEKYITEAGLRVSANAHRKLPYRFHYLPEKYLINAFAIPGGHVFIGEGLLSIMDSEDELAAVLGHEIEHIDHYDCADRVQQQAALQKIPLGGLLGLPIEVFEAGYSKDQELQADRDGTRLAVQSGYSANGAIRMFETFQRLYNEYHAKARNPQDELSRVALETLEGYFRSHPLPSERIAQVEKLIASENWPARPERDLEVAYVFWTDRAKEALNVHKYPQAQQLASRSLQMHPGQQKALEVLSRAQFAQADFTSAAASYRSLLELDPSNPILAEQYADALAAADRKTAIVEFRAWDASLKGTRPSSLGVPIAGLALLAGDATLAVALEKQSSPTPDLGGNPIAIGDLGIWYYRAGNYAKAEDLLTKAIEQRPGETSFITARAWTLIENRKLADALQSLPPVYQASDEHPDQTMARAVASWQAQQPDNALGFFDRAIVAQPEWGNPRWAQAQYSPGVLQSIQEIQQERERRKKLGAGAR